MKQSRMQQLIEAYGADPRRWPAEEAGQGGLMPVEGQVPAGLASGLDSAIDDALREAAALDSALDAALPTPTLPLGLRSRILAAAPSARRPWWRELAQSLGGLRLAGPAFACAFSLGLGLVWLLPEQVDGAAQAELDAYLSLAWIDPADSEDLP